MHLPKCHMKRAQEYRAVLESAVEDIFISGVSLSGITTESLSLIINKLEEGHSVRMLLMSPVFARNNAKLLEFNHGVAGDIYESLKTLESIKAPNLEVRVYDFFMPITMTGYYGTEDIGEVSFEVVDYLSGSSIEVWDASSGSDTHSFNYAKNKFEFYWTRSSEFTLGENGEYV